MVELQIGDIILVRGRKFRHKLTRLLAGLKLNHAVVYIGNGETQELNCQGVQKKKFDEAYADREIVILRLQTIDAVVDGRRIIAFSDALNMSKLNDLTLDIFGVVLTLLRLPTRNRKLRYKAYLCNEYIEEVYRRASNYFDRHDFRNVKQLDVDLLMREKYTDSELLTKCNLIKVHDYRWT